MDTRSLLACHPVFAQLPVATRERLALQARLMHLDIGDVLDDGASGLLVAGNLHTLHGPLSPGDRVMALADSPPYALTACTLLRWPAILEDELHAAVPTVDVHAPEVPGALPWRDTQSLGYAAVLQCIYAALDVAPWLVLEPLVNHCLLYRDASMWPLLCAALAITAVFGVGASIVHATLVTPLAVAWASALRRRSISVIFHNVATPHLTPSLERWWNRLRTTLRAVDQLQQHGALWVHEACQAAVCLVLLLLLATKMTAWSLAALFPLVLWRHLSGRLTVNAAHELFGIQLFRTLHTLVVLALCVQAVRHEHMAMGRLFAVVGLWVNAWGSSMHLLPLRSLPPAVRRQMPLRLEFASRLLRLRVTLSNVTLTYAGGAAPALRDVSVELAAGAALGIVGRSGAGKSTLARLIYGTITPESGTFNIDGAPAQGTSLAARRDQLAWLDAAAYLPHDDALDNLTLGASAVHMGRLPWACALCDIQPRNACMDTDVERAKLALARAMMRRPRLLILDGFFDNFTLEQAHAQLERLRRGAPDMSLLVMSRVPRVVSTLPHIVALDAGRVVCQGAPEALLQTPGLISYLDAEYAA